jgi:hypothetical protein
MVGLAIAGIFALIRQQQRTMAAAENRDVEFDEARRALGIEFDYETLRRIEGETVFNAGLTVALPAGLAKEIGALALSSEDAVGPVRLYGRLFPDSGLLKWMNEAADRLESTGAYKTYKEATDAFKAWIGRTLFGEDKRQGADDEEDSLPIDLVRRPCRKRALVRQPLGKMSPRAG